MTLHSNGSNMASGHEGPSNRRSRTTIACDRCAKAKIRCDGMSPCERCKSRNLTCTLSRPHNVLKRRLPIPQMNGLVSESAGFEGACDSATSAVDFDMLRLPGLSVRTSFESFTSD